MRSGPTPGITRRHERFDLHESVRVGGRVHAVVRWRTSLEELLEFFGSQPRIPHDPAHRKCIHRVMARDCEDANTVGHDDVLALTNNSEAGFL